MVQQKQAEKMDAQARAKHEVELHKNLVESLLSVHAQCSERVDWAALAQTPAPSKPSPKTEHAEKATAALSGYSPSLLDRLFGRVEQKRKALEYEVPVARQRDQDEYKVALSNHGDEMSEWEATRALAEGVLRTDLAALSDAVNHCDPFEDIRELGSEVSISLKPGPLAEVTFKANGPDVVPTEAKSLLSSGKVSVKKMPTAAYWELYQDYVCGCILRIGRELFSILPIDEVVVTATAEILNQSTGHMENTPIVSALLVRKTMEKLNFDKIDCSDSFRNFVHNMGFKRSSGFSAVEKVSPA